MSPGEYLGCGNHSCVLEQPRGMGTNGPCQCLKELPLEKRQRVAAYLHRLRTQGEMTAEPPRERLIDLATELARYFTSGNTVSVTRAMVSTESDLYILLRECMPHWEFEKGTVKTP